MPDAINSLLTTAVAAYYVHNTCMLNKHLHLHCCCSWMRLEFTAVLLFILDNREGLRYNSYIWQQQSSLGHSYM